MSAEDRADVARQRMEEAIPDCTRRAGELPPLGILPAGTWWLPGLLECCHAYVVGSFHGCILLCAGVAEGLSKYIARQCGAASPPADFRSRLGFLRNRGVITRETEAAFLLAWGPNGRNAYVHFNPDMETDQHRLERYARERVLGLCELVRELFAGHAAQGKFVPKHRHLFPPGKVFDVWLDLL